MTTVTAAVAREHRAPLTLEQLELDEIRDNEVRVRMVATGICHTDAVVRDGLAPTPLPAVLGHEGTGVVEEVGRSITTVSPGDHVVLAAAYCGTCRQCRAGRMAYCENVFAEDFGGRRRDGSPPPCPRADGTPISSHFFGQSSFSTYANVVETSIVRVDPAVPPEVLAPLGCGINTGAGSVLNELRPPAGSSFAVTGAGAVGLAAVMAARVAGCTTIVAIDLHDSRLELARELGATHTDQLPDGRHGRRAVDHHRRRGRQLRPRHHRRARCGERRGRCALHPRNPGARWSSGPGNESQPSTSTSPPC